MFKSIKVGSFVKLISQGRFTSTLTVEKATVNGFSNEIIETSGKLFSAITGKYLGQDSGPLYLHICEWTEKDQNELEQQLMHEKKNLLLSSISEFSGNITQPWLDNLEKIQKELTHLQYR